MIYSNLNTFKTLLNTMEYRDYKLQITRHWNDGYSVCLVSRGAHQDFALENSRNRNTPRLFKSVTPIFSLIESSERHGFSIEFLKHTKKDKDQLSLEV